MSLKKGLVERERNFEAVKELNFFLIKRVGIVGPLLHHAIESNSASLSQSTPIQREDKIILRSSAMVPQASAAMRNEMIINT